MLGIFAFLNNITSLSDLFVAYIYKVYDSGRIIYDMISARNNVEEEGQTASFCVIAKIREGGTHILHGTC